MSHELPPLAARDGDGQPLLVIGAGIVGLAIALALCRRGHPVLVIDRKGVANEASHGNAGAFAFSDILPLASPGIVRQAPRWLLDPLGPLSLRPAYLPQIAPWLWRFWRASQPARVAASTQVQAALMRLSAEALPELLQAAGATAMLRSGGNLHLYDSAASWRASLPGWQVRADHGIAFEHLHDRGALASLQPGLSPAFGVGTFVPGWQTIEDPKALATAVAGAVLAAGGRLCRAEALALQPGADAVQVQCSGGVALSVRQVIVAAGAWSHRLAASLGERIPLETERGYNTTLPPGAFDLRRQLSFCDHGFVATPIGGGVRVGGAVELAGLDAPPNHARTDTLLAKAQRFLPGLRADGGSRWMGFRPSLPDSLPVIGPARCTPRVLYAFGHGHLGLTQCAGTARLVADLVEGRTTAFDITALGSGRFA